MSSLLDVGIGLVVVFLVFSIVVSGVNEWLAQAFGRRGAYLRTGMERLINDQMVLYRVLHHPLIGSLYQRQATVGKPPSYVEPRNFALAIADVLLARASGGYTVEQNSNVLSVASLQSAIVSPALAASPIGIALGPILEQSEGDLDKALTGLEAWFNAGMDRVEGWYKARTHKILFVVGLLIASTCNVDTLEIYGALTTSGPLRASLVKNAEQIVATGKVGDIPLTDSEGRTLTTAELQSLRQLVGSLPSTVPLPIGYSCLSAAAKSNPWIDCWQELKATNADRSLSAWLIKFIGWILSALAGTLGASYWFALLTKAVNIRDSGNKPNSAKT